MTSVESTVPECFYYGRPAGSNEHMLPDWVARYLFDHKGQWSFIQQRSSSSLLWVENVGNEIDITTDLICGTCNGGWMRKLEQNASAFLKPMFDGVATTLTDKERSTLARWAVKTVTTFECDSPNSPVTPETVHRYIRQRGLPPTYEVFPGRYDGPRVFDRHRRVWTRVSATPEADHIAISTLLIGQVILFVAADPFGGHARPISFLGPDYLIPLMATPLGEITWPPQHAIDESLLLSLAEGDWLGMPPAVPEN